MVDWNQYTTYEEAAELEKCLYVFKKKSGKYLYIGKALRFGGPSGRYAYGYRYLVDALLQSGTTLHIATLTEKQWASVRDYENTLLASTKGRKTVNRQRPKTFNAITGLNGP